MKLNLGAGPCPLKGYVNIDRSYEEDTYGGVYRLSSPRTIKGEIYPLNETYFADDVIEEIRASHCLEHLSWRETMDAITHWVSLLKPGGVLKIAVPNFEWIARQYLAELDGADRHPHLTMYLMGGQTDENDYHKAIFDANGLKHGMELAGLVDVGPWTSEIADCASLPVSLNLMGTKPGVKRTCSCRSNALGICSRKPECTTVCVGNPDSGLTGSLGVRRGPAPCLTLQDGVTEAGIEEFEEDVRQKNELRDITGEHPDHISHFMAPVAETAETDEYLSEPTEKPGNILFKPQQIGAMMSCPRLGFMDNMFSCYALAATGIHLERSGGAFWDQGLTRLLENGLAAGRKYLLTLDYDSVFVAQDVIELYRIMASPGGENIDALVSMQIRREKEGVLLTVAGPDGNNRNEILSTELEQNILPIRTGHFGLTLIRADALRRMPKPWFMPVPDENGEWGDARRDSDVNFWCQWHACGNTLFAAPRVVIGHTEQVVSWPDKHLKTFRQGMSAYQENGKPDEAWK